MKKSAFPGSIRFPIFQISVALVLSSMIVAHPMKVYAAMGWGISNGAGDIISPKEKGGENRTNSTIQGQVVDENKQPMPGVNVVEKGTANGTVTDVAGKYSIYIVENAVLVFTFVGYKTQEISTTGRTVINVALASDAKTLDELVVVGYGEQSRKMLTTSISKVTAEDIGKQVAGTPGDALAGLSSGVQVQSARGGYPGAAPVIRVRGVGTIGGSADVLYVVDGYPLQDADNFNQINPSDIESIEVLKDAASAAIYGSRAANGVVIVTTKSGKAGKTTFDVNFYQGFQSQARTYEMMNRNEYLATVINADQINKILYNKVSTNPAFATRGGYPDTKWQDLVYRSARIRDFEVSASGGNEKVKFLISGGNFKQDGVVRGSSYERYTLRLNMNADLTSRLHAGVSLAPSYSDQYRMPSAGGFLTHDGGLGQSVPNPFFNAYFLLPIIPERLPNGDYGSLNNSGTGLASSLFNPLTVIENVKNRFQNYSLLGKTFLEYDLLQNLTVRSTIGISYTQIEQDGFVPPIVPTGNSTTANISTPSSASTWAISRNSSVLDWLWENMLTYNLSFGSEKQHHLTALVFGSIQKNKYKQVSTNGKTGTYTNAAITNPSSSTDLQGGVAYNLNGFVSIGGRLSYDFKNKYLFTVAVRRDESSKFGPNNRYAAFPSVSAAWRVVAEDFMENMRDKVSDLKFRASYGQTGNSNIGSFNWANAVVPRSYVLGGTRNLGAGLSGYENYDLTWEKNEQYDYGVDIGILKDKVTLGVDYYDRLTKGMLLNKDLPGVYGFARTGRANVGSIKNTGWEFNLGTNLKIKKVSWNANYNFSANFNKVVDLGGPTSLPAQSPLFFWANTHQVKVGESLGDISGFIVDGFFRRQEDLTKYPQWKGNANMVGDWRIRDVNADGIVSELDRTKLGNGIPRYYFGTTQSFTYKSFDLSILLQGVAKVNVINGNLRYWITSLYTYTINMPGDFINNYFDPRNPDADVKYPAPYRTVNGSQVNGNNNATNIEVFDASFVRIKNLTIGYTLPAETTQRLKIKRLRIYATGQNLFTFTRYPGLNPEVSVNSADSAGNTENMGTGSSAVLAGVDFGAYPAIRIFTCGVNCSF